MAVAPEPERAEIIEVEVRKIQPKRREPGLAMLVAGSAVAVGARTARSAWRMTENVTHRLASGRAGRAVQRVADAALGETAGDGLRELREAAEMTVESFAELTSVVLPRVVQVLDVDAVLQLIDLDDIIKRVDVNGLLDQIQVDALLARVDIDRLLDRVDIDALLERVDIDMLLARADVDALITRVDIDGLLARVDVDAFLDRVDIESIVVRARVGNIVARSTGEVAGTALDVGRRQAVGLDALILGVVNRVLRRQLEDLPKGPPELLPTDEEADG